MPTSKMIGILGSGAYFPKKTLEVKHLAKKYHLNYHQLLKDHGIKKIHISDSSEDELFMATKAAKQALNDSGLSAKEVDVVILCKGITRQKTARTYSSQIIENIKAKKAYGFDIEGGMIGGLIGIQIANDIIKNNYQVNNAIVVASQEFDELYLFGGGASRLKNMIFGDGAAALVLSNNSVNNTILASEFVIDNYTNFIDEMLVSSLRQETGLKKVLKRLKSSVVVKNIGKKKKMSKLTDKWVNNSYKVVNASMKSINLDITDIDHFIKTQLSLKETELLSKKLRIDADRIYNASAEKGHLGHADILYNLHSTLKNHDLRNLDIIALVTANYDCSSGAIVLRR